MSSVSVHLVEKPTDQQLDAAVAVCRKAFKGDTSLTAMLGGNHDIEQGLFRSMLAACAVGGSFYIVTDDISDPTKIYAVGAWFGPGQMMFATEEQRDAGWSHFFMTLSPEAQKWWLETFLVIHEGELNKQLEDNYLGGYFANVIATDPDHQRKGYATSIIHAIFARADQEGKSVSLATQSQNNAVWYQKLGFQLLSQLEIPAETGAWPDFFLTRAKP